MNLLLFSDADRCGENTIVVRDGRLRHLLAIHRAAVGDSVRVGEIGGLMGDGEIRSLDDQTATIGYRLDTPPPPKLSLLLVLALPRPKMLRRILRSVAELGVAELQLINSYRVEKSYWQSPALAEATVRQYLLQGLEQSRDTVLPTVTSHTRFKPFVEDELADLLAGRHGLVAHPGEYPPCPRGVEGPLLLAIGPEGGFIPYEIEKLQAAGCQPVSLGPRILRVENAVTSLIARLF